MIDQKVEKGLEKEVEVFQILNFLMKKKRKDMIIKTKNIIIIDIKSIIIINVI